VLSRLIPRTGQTVLNVSSRVPPIPWPPEMPLNVVQSFGSTEVCRCECIVALAENLLTEQGGHYKQLIVIVPEVILLSKLVYVAISL
jgi:hypothetical protein